MSCAIVQKTERVLSFLKGCGVNMDLVYDLAGPGQLDTVLRIVEEWQRLPNLIYTVPAARMQVIISALTAGGVEDDDRRTDVWAAARYIEIKLAGRKLLVDD